MLFNGDVVTYWFHLMKSRSPIDCNYFSPSKIDAYRSYRISPRQQIAMTNPVTAHIITTLHEPDGVSNDRWFETLRRWSDVFVTMPKHHHDKPSDSKIFYIVRGVSGLNCCAWMMINYFPWNHHGAYGLINHTNAAVSSMRSDVYNFSTDPKGIALVVTRT